jgi:formylglycine-generating enzyme
MKNPTPSLALFLSLAACLQANPLTYHHITVEETPERVIRVTAVAPSSAPRWSREVVQTPFVWDRPSPVPFFREPIPFVIAPDDPAQPFYPHNHLPSVAWLPNGDLMAVWYSTVKERDPELTVLSSRLRAGKETWDPSSEFFKAHNHNMHGTSIFHDGRGTLYHFNGMGRDGVPGWDELALLGRSSTDNGVKWTEPFIVAPEFSRRHLVISGTRMTSDGMLIVNADAAPTHDGGTALHLSTDGGKTWSDPGKGQPLPKVAEGAVGRGTIAGIHAKLALVTDDHWVALGRGDDIDGHMPMSVSRDRGQTWTYSATPFPPIRGGQRLVLLKLSEGPLVVFSFTNTDRKNPRVGGMEFRRADGSTFTGHGLFAALSYDDGKTWPVRKLITPAPGVYDGGAWTGEFTASADNAEHAGYLAGTQTPDGVVHLLSSRLHYRFNLPWLLQPAPSTR